MARRLKNYTDVELDAAIEKARRKLVKASELQAEAAFAGDRGAADTECRRARNTRARLRRLWREKRRRTLSARKPAIVK